MIPRLPPSPFWFPNFFPECWPRLGSAVGESQSIEPQLLVIDTVLWSWWFWCLLPWATCSSNLGFINSSPLLYSCCCNFSVSSNLLLWCNTSYLRAPPPWIPPHCNALNISFVISVVMVATSWWESLSFGALFFSSSATSIGVSPYKSNGNLTQQLWPSERSMMCNCNWRMCRFWARQWIAKLRPLFRARPTILLLLVEHDSIVFESLDVLSNWLVSRREVQSSQPGGAPWRACIDVHR